MTQITAAARVLVIKWVGQRVRLSLTEGALVALVPQPVEFVRVEKISVQTEGQRPLERDDLTNLFPYWRRDLWSK